MSILVYRYFEEQSRAAVTCCRVSTEGEQPQKCFSLTVIFRVIRVLISFRKMHCVLGNLFLYPQVPHAYVYDKIMSAIIIFYCIALSLITWLQHSSFLSSTTPFFLSMHSSLVCHYRCNRERGRERREQARRQLNG